MSLHLLLTKSTVLQSVICCCFLFFFPLKLSYKLLEITFQNPLLIISAKVSVIVLELFYTVLSSSLIISYIYIRSWTALLRKDKIRFNSPSNLICHLLTKDAAVPDRTYLLPQQGSWVSLHLFVILCVLTANVSNCLQQQIAGDCKTALVLLPPFRARSARSKIGWWRCWRKAPCMDLLQPAADKQSSLRPSSNTTPILMEKCSVLLRDTQRNLMNFTCPSADPGRPTTWLPSYWLPVLTWQASHS